MCLLLSSPCRIASWLDELVTAMRYLLFDGMHTVVHFQWLIICATVFLAPKTERSPLTIYCGWMLRAMPGLCVYIPRAILNFKLLLCPTVVYGWAGLGLIWMPAGCWKWHDILWTRHCFTDWQAIFILTCARVVYEANGATICTYPVWLPSWPRITCASRMTARTEYCCNFHFFCYWRLVTHMAHTL